MACAIKSECPNGASNYPECTLIPECTGQPGDPSCAARRCGDTAACLSTLPRCELGQCVACQNPSDCSRFSETPVCGPAGACVPCREGQADLCVNRQQVCRLDQMRCVDCSTNDDCKSSAHPICESETCRGCRQDAECAAIGKLCQEDSGKCVECTSNADCKSGSLPICEDGTCRACEADADCAGWSKVCREDTGECVECEPSPVGPTRENCPNGRACHPTSFTCTGDVVRSIANCGRRGDGSGISECATDSECEIGHRCLAVNEKHYCLIEVHNKPCPAVTRIRTRATSILGVNGDYCFPPQYIACEYLIALGRPCQTPADCGGGLCVRNTCTYHCEAPEDCSAFCLGVNAYTASASIAPGEPPIPSRICSYPQ